MLKKGGLIVGGIIILLVLWQYELVFYGITQARGQLTILWQAKPVTEVLEDPSVADSVKRRIKLVQDIKKFATDSLGLKDPGSYQSYYDQNGEPVLWVVTACEPFALKNRKWHFPLLGSFSYKGFFNKKMALKEQDKLQKQGWDTRVRTASAWSTLGFFEDPILSEVLFRQEGMLGNLIFHELTHATVFIKDSLSFNENLASFIGDKGAQKFLYYYFGPNSAELKNYKQMRHDQRLFREHFLRGGRSLDSLYRSFGPDMKKKNKEKLKEKMINSIVKGLDTLEFQQPDKYKSITERMLEQENKPNNAFFMAFKRYQSKQEDFNKIYKKQFGGNLKDFISYYKENFGEF